MNRFLQIINDIISFEEKIQIFKNTKKTLLIGISVILLFNIFTYILTDYVNIKKIQSREKTTGLSHDKAQHFFYFFYYTGNFPLTSLNKKLKFSKDDAINEINNNGNNLIMEYGHWSRLGENLRIITYYPNAIIRGSPENPSVKLFNSIFFVLGLILVFIAFVKINKALLGSIIVAIVNMTPFFIYEIYQNQNILALLTSGFLIVLALNLKLIFAKKVSIYKLIIISILSGIVVGFTSEIRGETIIIIGSTLLIYLLSKSLKWYLKIIPIVLVIIAMFFTKTEIKNYFNNNFEQTYQLVKEHNGHVYNGKRNNAHIFWHPIYCGLGDFDKKYGYKWSDRVAFEYSIPILKEKYNLDFKYNKGDLFLDEYYDKDKLYYKKFDDFVEYEEIMKDKVLSDIKSDPLWYANILVKRFVRILTITLPIPLIGWISLLLIFILFRIKQWNYLKFIIISLPLSFTPFVIYSGDGTTYNSFFPIITISIIIYWLITYKIKSTKRAI